MLANFRGASGGLRVDPGELLGASWGLLGRFVAHEAPKNRETRSEGTAKTRPRGPRWPPGGPQEGPTYPQEGPKTVPKGFENDIQEKKTKTSKSTTLSTEKLDFQENAARKSIKNRKREGLKAIKIADEASRSPKGAKMSPKESPRGAQRRLPTIDPTVLPRSRNRLWRRGPPGAPSRARGILDKSSKERIKNRFVDLWMR